MGLLPPLFSFRFTRDLLFMAFKHELAILRSGLPHLRFRHDGNRGWNVLTSDLLIANQNRPTDPKKIKWFQGAATIVLPP